MSHRLAWLAFPLLFACSASPKPQGRTTGDVDVGYGTRDRSETAGAVQTLDAEDVAGVPYTRVEEMIAGRFPGVDVRRNPDGSYNILIRGRSTFVGGTDPLVVVDGVPASDVGVLAMINPRDVRRIDVLRDAASTSMYGVRGANGVILIRTKRGDD